MKKRRSAQTMSAITKGVIVDGLPACQDRGVTKGQTLVSRSRDAWVRTGRDAFGRTWAHVTVMRSPMNTILCYICGQRFINTGILRVERHFAVGLRMSEKCSSGRRSKGGA